MTEPIVTEPIVRTESLGGSALAVAGMGGRLGEWYVTRPSSAAGWKERAESVRGAANEQWLSALAAAFAATGAAAARLDRVANGRGVVVTTGQQPGLFGGPIYTWSKALSALALADEIEAATGVPTAPVFWAANDDADFAEASWTAISVTGGAERLSVPAGAALGRPMSEMPLTDATAALEALARACATTIDEWPLRAARNAYRPGVTVGGAYLELLRELFEPLGIAVLDAAHESVTSTARPLLVRALDRSEDVANALRDRDSAIIAGGYALQVTEVAGLSLVFERPVGTADKRRVPLAEARALAAQVGDGAGDATVLSPNVLLRPVIERAILPTVSYVAGPGEFAYFAQVTAVAQALKLAMPLAVPRWSTTIVEPHVARILARFAVEESELADPHRAETRLATESVPPDLALALANLRRDVDARSAEVSGAAQGSGLPLPPEVVAGAQRAMHHRLDRLGRRVVAAAKRRHDDTMTQIGTARGSLYPLGTRQERALNLLPLMARHGSIIVDRMLAGARTHARALLSGESTSDAPSDQTQLQSAR
jgi:bacillithiol synthase